jgi:phosphoglycerate dehydrogenase-like enzyme
MMHGGGPVDQYATCLSAQVQVMRSAPDDEPVIILCPQPQRATVIFAPDVRARLEARFRVVDLEADSSRAAFEAALPYAFAIVGQPSLTLADIRRAHLLRAILNVEGNFLPNIDYAACFARGIRVLGCGPAYADAVAEYALGLAIDLARGISREDRAFRGGRERWVADGNHDAVLLGRSNVGFIGYGNIGRALHRLLAPFRPVMRVVDPWLPDSVLREAGMAPASLEDVLSRSEFIFALATVTPESERLLDAAHLDLIRMGARLILVSRAAITDHAALVERVAAGRFLVAIDVWPDEPAAVDEPARRLEGAVLSAHRAGGIPQAYRQIGEMVVDDLELLARGLPPARMQIAAPELVGRYRNRPVDPGRQD